MTPDEQKRAAGEAAAELVEAGMIVGLGTGSTAAWFVKALAARTKDIRGVPTSEATATLARDLGLTVVELDSVQEIDLTVDGADEIGPGLSLIKGGGAALLREKLVWEASRRCVCIADAAKPVKLLGQFALPIEVVRFGHTHTARRIADIAVEFDMPPARLRMTEGRGGPVLTDGGNVIYDMKCGRIEDPAALAAALKGLTGVVDHGLFLDLADLALIGTDDGVVKLHP
jgi:ribose 5-phosphate isomerase A